MDRFKKMCMAICFVILTTSLCYTPAFADDSNKMVNELWESPSETEVDEVKDANADDETGDTAAGFTFIDFIRAIVATVFVIGLLLFLLKFMSKKSRAYQSASLIKNLGGTNLGSNKSIQIVKIGDRLFIVGVGEDVQLLKEITEPEDVNRILEEYNQTVDQSLVPSDMLSKFLQRKKEKTSTDSSFAEQFKRQLEDLAHNRKQLRKELKKKGKQDDE